MFKEIVDDARRTPDIGRSQKLTMSTLCSGELKTRKIGFTVFLLINAPRAMQNMNREPSFCTQMCFRDF